MNDRQYQLIIEKLSAIEATLTANQKQIERLTAKVDANIRADSEIKQLVDAIDVIQKDVLALKDELTA